ncbi:MAG: peptide-methionine (S)-S-oxide reductase MsrA [Gemmatimonadota bacterium]|nr:MAG: peptide-methionine (S)-S-oxide reductase MsrA [Gemmatimonadota bacterium]
MDREVATLGGGCFWCLEAVFELVGGVERVESGYAGGHAPNPTYEQVCSGATGHAEVVQVTFDPSVIGYREILEVFFAIHDPTTPNRQGPDVGTQYRSAIYHHSEAQRETAEGLIQELEREGIFRDRIVTEVAALADFHPAEEHHQEYYRNNRSQPYCMFLIDPKVAKFRKQFSNRLKPLPPGS